MIRPDDGRSSCIEKRPYKQNTQTLAKRSKGRKNITHGLGHYADICGNSTDIDTINKAIEISIRPNKERRKIMRYTIFDRIDDWFLKLQRKHPNLPLHVSIVSAVLVVIRIILDGILQ